MTKTDKWQTQPLVREGAPKRQDRNFGVKNLWSKIPDWARHQDIMSRLTVSRNVTLTLTWPGIQWTEPTIACKRSKERPVRMEEQGDPGSLLVAADSSCARTTLTAGATSGQRSSLRPEHGGLPSCNAAAHPLRERPFSGLTHSVCDPTN
jgi:hypothetical protein